MGRSGSDGKIAINGALCCAAVTIEGACAVRMWFAVVAAVLVVAAGCGVTAPGRGPRLPEGAAFDYQLGGAYPPPGGAAVVFRDSSAEPAPGMFSVCYVNGFQSQPQNRALWLERRRDLVLSGPRGGPLADPDWPDELILDTSTPRARERIAAIAGEAVAACAAAGFQAVEFDNLDSYTRSWGALSAADNLSLARVLTGLAHEHGLLAGQKNAAELSPRAKRQSGFDFAIAEECVAYRECSAYTAVYGQRVLDVEYPDTLDRPFTEACADPATPRSTILRDRPLVVPGEEGYRYESC